MKAATAVRIERDAARHGIGGIFQGENDGSDEYAADGKFLDLVHGVTAITGLGQAEPSL
jgi:hypothetical protein